MGPEDYDHRGRLRHVVDQLIADAKLHSATPRLTSTMAEVPAIAEQAKGRAYPVTAAASAADSSQTPFITLTVPDVVRRDIGDARDLLGTEGPDHPRRGAKDHRVLGVLLALGDDGAGADDAALADDGAVHHDRSHADQHVVLDGAA